MAFIRFQDSQGVWSGARGYPFTVIGNEQEFYTITAAEYYIDSDPGEGNGIPINVFDNQEVDIDIDISTDNLDLGEHSVFVRFQDSEGVWSPEKSHKFTVAHINPGLYVTDAEYFFNSDPGEGYGTPIYSSDGSLDAGLESFAYSFSPPSDLPHGENILYLRAKSSDQVWGAPSSHSFTHVTIPPLVQADMFSSNEDEVLNIDSGSGVMINDEYYGSQFLSVELSDSTSNGQLTLNEDGSFSYAPSQDYNGFDQFTYINNFGDLTSEEATVNIEIFPVNDRPLTDSQSLSTLEDIPIIETQLTGYDVDGDSLYYVITQGPSNGTAQINSSDLLTYTPNQDFFGLDTIMIASSDSLLLSAHVGIYVEIESVNDFPVLSNIGSQQTLEDNDLMLSLSAIDVDILTNGQELTYSATSSDTSLVVVSVETIDDGQEGSLLFDVQDNQNGIAEITVTVSDGQGRSIDSEVVELVVVSVNDSPELAEIGAQETLEDIDFQISLETIDVDILTNSQMLTYSASSSDESIATVSVATEGNGETGILYVDVQDDQYGQLEITLEVNDNYSRIVDSETFVLDIIPVNDQPVADSQSLSTLEDIPIIETQLTGYDVDGDSLYYVITQGPSNGTAQINSSDLLTYTPNQDFFGLDTIMIASSDSLLLSAHVGIYVEIESVNDFPVLSNIGSQQTLEDNDLMLSLSAIDVDILTNGQELTYSATSSDTSLVVVSVETIDDGQEGSLLFDVQDNQNGIAEITVTVSDGQGRSIDSEVVELVVVSVNDSPELAEIGAQETLEDIDFQISLETIDVDILTNSQMLTYSASSSDESIATVSVATEGNGETGILYVDVQDDQYGQLEITLEVNDNYSRIVDSETFVLDVIPVNDPPVAILPDDQSYEIDYSNNVGIQISATNSYDVDSDISLYRWTINQQQIFESDTSFIDIELEIGAYDVILEVFDLEGEYSQDFMNIDILDCFGGNDESMIYDCNYECAGDALLDDCDTCDDNLLNDCITYSFEYLHQGANLISFYAIPTDSTLNSLISSSNAYSIIGEGVAATYNQGLGWFGSLSEVTPTDGYWLKLSSPDTLVVYDAIPVLDDIVYNMHFGSNLISFPFSGCYDINDIISDEAVGYIDRIIGEGVSLINDPVFGWVGSIDQFCGGEGYWITVNEDILFQYSTSTQTVTLKKNEER